jgi:hypothetical protein
MQNPMGADFEDLPVHHIVNSTCKTSLQIIRVRRRCAHTLGAQRTHRCVVPLLAPSMLTALLLLE